MGVGACVLSAYCLALLSIGVKPGNLSSNPNFAIRLDNHK